MTTLIQRLRQMADHTGLDAVAELLREAAAALEHSSDHPEHHLEMVPAEQPLALKLADGLTDMWGGYEFPGEDFEQQAAAELRRLHAENEGRAARIAALYEQIEREEALMSNLLLNLEREKASRQAAQIENEDLKSRIARSGVELQRAVLAEREVCARVCDERAMKNEHACEGLDDEDATSLRSAAWQMSVCAAAIRARGAAPQQEGEIK